MQSTYCLIGVSSLIIFLKSELELATLFSSLTGLSLLGSFSAESDNFVPDVALSSTFSLLFSFSELSFSSHLFSSLTASSFSVSSSFGLVTSQSWASFSVLPWELSSLDAGESNRNSSSSGLKISSSEASASSRSL